MELLQCELLANNKAVLLIMDWVSYLKCFSYFVFCRFQMTLEIFSKLHKSQKTIWIPMQQKTQAGSFSFVPFWAKMGTVVLNNTCHNLGNSLGLSQGVLWSNKAKCCSVLGLLRFNNTPWHRYMPQHRMTSII